MKVLVTLSPDELREAATGGIERRVSGIFNNRRSTHPQTPDWKQNWWESEVIGAIGEFAVAKALDLPWSPTVGRVDCHDVGDYEVRTTQQPTPVLRFRTHNNPNNKYILCSYKRDRVLIQGWLTGRTILDLGYMEYDDVYTAGVDQLYSITDLNEQIAWGETVQPYQR